MSQQGMTLKDILNVINTADVITTWPYEYRASSGDQTVMVFLDSKGEVSHLSTDYIEGIGLNHVPVHQNIKTLLLKSIHARKYKLYGITQSRAFVKTR
jgi:hypothetical protein